MASPRVRDWMPPATMVSLGIVSAGNNAVESVVSGIFPISARHFTSSIFLIGALVAAQRLGGCLVQPVVACRSDGASRRQWLLRWWPASLLTLAIVGVLPTLAPHFSRGQGAIAVVWIVAALGMQGVSSICRGCCDPLYGDIFAPAELGRASAVRIWTLTAVYLVMAFVALPLSEHSEFIPYGVCLGFLGLSWLLTRLALPESASSGLRKPGGVLEALTLLRDREMICVVTVGSLSLAVSALATMLHPLFVTETLGLSKGVLGSAIGVGALASLVVTYPIGTLADRWGPWRVLRGGFVLTGAACVGFALWVTGKTGLFCFSVLAAVGISAINIPITPLIYRKAPPDRRGQAFAAVQVVRAAAAALTVLGAGAAAQAFDSFRVCYAAAAAFCLGGIVATVARRPRAEPAEAGLLIRN